jgi:hypothetical protein
MIESRLRRLEALFNRLAAVVDGRTAPSPRRLQTATDVLTLLHEQVEVLRAATWVGTVEKARALGFLANLALRTIETADLAARLDQLEATLKPANGNAKR